MMPDLKKYKNLISFYGWLTLLIGLGITGMISYYIYSKNYHEDQMRFEYEADEIWKRIQFRMDRYEGALIQARAFFLSSDNVSRTEFHRYFEKTKLTERYPGIQALGLAVRIKKDDLKSHVKNIRKELPHYTVWPEDHRNEYYSILYIEPMDWRNQRAIGYDMYSEPVRHEAMKKAMLSGLPTVSGMVTLIQEAGSRQQPGFNLYVPYYKENVPLKTPTERANALIGFIYAPFRANDLFTSILSESKLNIDVEIFENGEMKAENLIFDFDGKPNFIHSEKVNKFRIVKHVTLNGHDFILHFVPLPSFRTTSDLAYPSMAAIIGLVISFLIFRIFMLTKKTQDVLQEAINARDEFFSIASHELKTPLTSLKLQAQLMKRTLDKNPPNFREKIFNLSDQSEKQTQRLERLVDDMLDISRIRTGRLTIQTERFNLCDMVTDVVGRMKEQFSVIPGGAPQTNYISCENAVGEWDKMRLEQVVTNLLSNAIKYGSEKEISIEVQATSDRVYIKVKDNGIGIPLEFRNKIFERFERASGTAKSITGLGLGLYISEQIVRSHGGRIWVESEVGKGSTFTVELPTIAG
ncbi:CHASE domain-containing sensor histidine kinase [Peredibacter starrii]|uniref:histidine kinase n=1 Tax=Peredibacter starrii TaxID=28202 RepID=A0AAX4HLW2_9BACT|nr:CHASE domain-containing protein [Peredibacter starrii]WPU64201.1 CHASE domain-containing protein [Peredibacter starrii]